MAAEVERQLLNHYKLTSLYPSEWPDREDESDEESEDEARGAVSPGAPMSPRSSKMRFPAFGRHASILSSGSSSQNIGSTVQKDEPDPLGMVSSVVQQLRRQGLPVEDDLKLRNRFMLSSTTFSPTLFLSQVHQTASTESLLQGLDFLSRSIEQKSASLKVLVESNFERFVRAKATIDNVYTEMRAQGSETPAEPTISQSLRRPHSRHQSKSHFRNTSGAFSAKPPSAEGRKKNALTKESEYGVQGIKAPLIELAVKAEEVWGPALGGKEKEEGLKGTLSFLENNKSLFQTGAVIQDSIRRRDFDTLAEEYQKAKRYADDARNMADSAARQDQALTDHQIHQILVTARVWSDVEEQITAFKRDSWRHLSDSHANREIAFNDERRELHMELIAVLLQLGVDDNPIMVWLSGRQADLKNKFTRTFDRARIEIEVLRRRLAAANAPSLHLLKLHLQSVSQGSNGSLDTPKVLEFWDRLQSAMGSLLALQGGLLGEIADFWETAQSFMSGKAQQSFPAAVFNSPPARRHLELPAESVQQLHSDAAELVTLVRESIYSFFADPPVEDISALFSPIPPTPITPTSALTTPKDQRSFSFDVNNLPPPSPSRGEPWEKYAFWAPFANSLSGANCLSKVLILVGTAASELASLSVVRENHRLSESLKALVGAVRERSVQAVCAAWNTDAEKCKVLEDWTRNPERRDLTNMPARFQAFEETILGNMQKILYLSDAMTRSDSADVVVPPSAKLLQMVRHQFVTSLYKALSGTVENAEKKTRLDDAENSDLDGLTIPARGIYESDPNASTVDATDRVSEHHRLSHMRPIANKAGRASVCYSH